MERKVYNCILRKFKTTEGDENNLKSNFRGKKPHGIPVTSHISFCLNSSCYAARWWQFLLYMCPKVLSWIWLKWKKSKVGNEHGFIGLRDLAMANFRHLFLKHLAHSLAPIKLVLCQEHFSTFDFVPRLKSWHGIYLKNKPKQTAASFWPQACLTLLISFLLRVGAGGLTWFLVKPCVRLNTNASGFAGAAVRNVKS